MNKTGLWILAILLAGGFTYMITQYDNNERNAMISNTMNMVRNTANKAVDNVEDTMDAVASGAEAAIDSVASGAEAVLEEGAALIDEAAEAVDEAIDSEEDADDETDPVEASVTHDGYVAYSEEAVKEAVADGKQVALFFHAARCPTCVVLDEDLLENEGDIENNTVIFKVDYDTATDLKDRYVVTSQHTVVYLDANMDAVTSVKGLNTTTEVLAKFE